MNCKPGDLAFIIKSNAPENLGLFVDVIRPFNGVIDAPYPGSEVGPLWLCRARGAICYTSTIGDMKLYEREGYIPDNKLHPVRGLRAGNSRDAKVLAERSTAESP